MRCTRWIWVAAAAAVAVGCGGSDSASEFDAEPPGIDAGAADAAPDPIDAGPDATPPECTTAAECDDANPCTDDSCDGGVCTNANTTAACEDGDPCTDGDICTAGVCTSGGPLDCDDGNACTDDSCDGVTGCIATPNTDPCDDGDACTTVDLCDAGVCVGSAPPDCDDGNVCTADTCDAALGCVNTNNSDPCDDGNACTTTDTRTESRISRSASGCNARQTRAMAVSSPSDFAGFPRAGNARYVAFRPPGSAPPGVEFIPGTDFAGALDVLSPDTGPPAVTQRRPPITTRRRSRSSHRTPPGTAGRPRISSRSGALAKSGAQS